MTMSNLGGIGDEASNRHAPELAAVRTHQVLGPPISPNFFLGRFPRSYLTSLNVVLCAVRVQLKVGTWTMTVSAGELVLVKHTCLT